MKGLLALRLPGTQESDGQSATCQVPAIVGQHFAIGDISPVITLIERLWI
jgi:hypothetical protein